MYTLLTFLLMAERVTMQAQEFSTIPTEHSSGFSPDYELDLYELWQTKSRKKVLAKLIDIISTIK